MNSGLFLFRTVVANPIRQAVVEDTLRALIVYVQFSDDHTRGDPNLDSRSWPVSRNGDPPPAYASHLLAPTPTPPFVDSTVTDYFYRQSNGRFVLFGDVYPSIITTTFPESHYHRPLGGYGVLTKEVLERMDGSGFDFSVYDHNGDGSLDQIFIVVRRDSERDARHFAWTGASCLDARCAPGAPHGLPLPPLIIDGKRVDWNKSGSYIIHRTPGNILPFYYMVRMMAHELGHDLWARYFVHVPAITRNDVPAASNRSRPGTNAIGYALMAGAGGGLDCRGNETISAFERALLGWIDCPAIVGDAAISLSDLYTTSACRTISLGSDARGRMLYLTNHQRIGPFARARAGGSKVRYEMGLLRTTGLLVSMSDGVRFDVLPADNSLDLAATDDAYLGDLFSPDTRSQITPWTRPNVNGFTLYPARFAPDWHAVDRIRYADDESGTLLFDVFSDYRLRPVVREDSWMGPETTGYLFTAPVLVTGQSTLTISTSVSIGRRIRIDPGSSVVIAPGSVVTILPDGILDVKNGGRLVIEGTLSLDGLRTHFPGSVVEIAPGGRLTSSFR